MGILPSEARMADTQVVIVPAVLSLILLYMNSGTVKDTLIAASRYLMLLSAALSTGTGSVVQKSLAVMIVCGILICMMSLLLEIFGTRITYFVSFALEFSGHVCDENSLYNFIMQYTPV